MFVTEQATGAERDTELRATRARAARCAIRSSASARTRRGPSEACCTYWVVGVSYDAACDGDGALLMRVGRYGRRAERELDRWPADICFCSGSQRQSCRCVLIALMALDAWGQRSAQGRAGGRTTGKLIV